MGMRIAVLAAVVWWVGCAPRSAENPTHESAQAAPVPVKTQPGQGSASPAPEASATREDPTALVDITELDDSVDLDIRYATPDNFAGVAVYPVARCLLRREVARRLIRVQAALARRGLGLRLWDCYRPVSVQQRFWELVPDPRYVARPVVVDGVAIEGSKHNRGAAVDLTLIDAAGEPLEMPTDYDDFTPKSHRGYRGASAAARNNAAILERAMVAEGFIPLASEWWHFDGPGWQNYPLEDVPLR